jgi:hypothetical protein
MIKSRTYREYDLSKPSALASLFWHKSQDITICLGTSFRSFFLLRGASAMFGMLELSGCFGFATRHALVKINDSLCALVRSGFMSANPETLNNGSRRCYGPPNVSVG